MTTIDTDLYADITFTLIKCELIDNIADLLLTNTHVNHIGRNIVQISYRTAKQQPLSRLEESGEECWKVNGVLHRDWGLPAIVRISGRPSRAALAIYKNAHVHPAIMKFHRKNQHVPSTAFSVYYVAWWKHGMQHRGGNAPAVAHSDGENTTKEWWKDGKLHRENDKPATVVTFLGEQRLQWFCHGQLHRNNDKPAGITIAAKPPTIYDTSIKFWYNYGQLHRDGDLPAIVCANGTTEWHKHGKRHRDADLPAVILHDGTTEWYNNGVQYTPKK